MSAHGERLQTVGAPVPVHPLGSHTKILPTSVCRPLASGLV